MAIVAQAYTRRFAWMGVARYKGTTTTAASNEGVTMARNGRLQSAGFGFVIVSVAACLAGPAVQAQDELDRTPTNCLTVGRIDRDVAINDRIILFYVKGGAVYRNDLQGSCTILQLGETRLTYLYRTQTARLTQLCDVDMITIDSPEHRRNACELGKFTPITAEEADLYRSGQFVAAPSPAPGSESQAPAGAQQGEFTISVAGPQAAPACVASVTTGYFQLNTVARVESDIQIEGCTAATGKYTIAARIRNPAGETQTLEFEETFERADDQSMMVKRDYPIGENVELVNVRTRAVRCECADQPTP
jgi:hypothetical protein